MSTVKTATSGANFAHMFDIVVRQDGNYIKMFDLLPSSITKCVLV